MGIGKLSTRSSKQVIKPEFFNTIKDALIGMIVPRNISGDATDKAGSLGSNDYRFDELHVDKINSPGANFIGMIVPYYTFNNLTTVGEGWMKCDGRVINQTNYDLEHGAGSWAKHIGSTPLDGRYLPNMNNRMLIGNPYPDSQTGFLAIGYRGNQNNIVNSTHSHIWYKGQLNAKTFDVSGLPTDLVVANLSNSSGSIKNVISAAAIPNGSSASSLNTVDHYTNRGGDEIDITPESIECYFAMRIK